MKETLIRFKAGSKYLNIHSSINKDNLTSESDKTINSNQYDIVKFIPASGAATRMFQDLYTFLEDGVYTEYIDRFIENIKNFSFYEELELSLCTDDKSIIQTVVDKYGYLPKSLIKIHTYGKEFVNPIEEHIYEAKQYLNNDHLRLHFTISKEHEMNFKEFIKDLVNEKLEITYSFQEAHTDTIAVDTDNNPFIIEDGEVLKRPGGHGALIVNLNNIDADIIYIKNIDNVCHRSIIKDTVESKMILTNIGLTVQNELYKHITSINENTYNLDVINSFLKDTLNITYKHKLTKEKALGFLNRPLNVCGVVKNTGEPGGGPFIVDNGDYLDPQIVELKEIDMNKHKSIVEAAEYFNPVDLVCFVKDYKGKKFNLLNHINQDRYFISEKTYKGKTLKAMEHPGLWNGAMHDWNTVFVEVPLTTFNPIKTVNDLLREGHQGN